MSAPFMLAKIAQAGRAMMSLSRIGTTGAVATVSRETVARSTVPAPTTPAKSSPSAVSKAADVAAAILGPYNSDHGFAKPWYAGITGFDPNITSPINGDHGFSKPWYAGISSYVAPKPVTGAVGVNSWGNLITFVPVATLKDAVGVNAWGNAVFFSSPENTPFIGPNNSNTRVRA